MQHAQGFNTAAHGSNPGPLSRESDAPPLSHCALHIRICSKYYRQAILPSMI